MFLMSCWRACIGSIHPLRVSRSALGLLDWRSLMDFAVQNKMQYFLYLGLDKSCLDFVPTDTREYLFQSWRTNERLNHKVMLELLRVNQLFASCQVKYLFFKGPLLSMAGCSPVSARVSGDIDLLVHRIDFLKAKEELFLAGYHAPLGENHEKEYLQAQLDHKEECLSVDLHYGIPPRHLLINPDLLWDSVKFQRFKSNELPVPCIESHVLILCVDGYKNAWNSIGRACDIAALLKCHPINWTALFSKAKHHKVSGILNLGLLIVRWHCKSSYPLRVLVRMYLDIGVVCVAVQIFRLSSIVHASQAEYRGDAVLATLYNIAGLDNWIPNRLAYYTTRVIQLLKPNHKDEVLIFVPSCLRYSLYIVRPCRLIYEYIIRPLFRRLWPT